MKKTLFFLITSFLVSFTTQTRSTYYYMYNAVAGTVGENQFTKDQVNVTKRLKIGGWLKNCTTLCAKLIMVKTLLFFLLVSPLITLAQVPINDNCNVAILLTPSTPCLYTASTLTNATQSFVPNFCGAGASALANDVWFKFVATNTSAQITAQPATTGGNMFNLVVELFNTCNTATFIPTPITCADLFGNLQPETINTTSLTVGQTYYFRVFQYKNNTSTPNPADPTFSVCVVSSTLTTALTETQNTQNGVIVYPNPSINSEFTINAPFTDYSIRLYNAIGQNIYFTEATQKDKPNHKNIKINTQNTGILFLEIKNNQTNQVIVKKVQ